MKTIFLAKLTGLSFQKGSICLRKFTQGSFLNGGGHFMSLINDYSRMWIYILKSKDETLEKCKVWKALVENQSGFKLKCLIADNGLEFCNKEFESFYQSHRIKRHNTVRLTL